MKKQSYNNHIKRILFIFFIVGAFTHIAVFGSEPHIDSQFFAEYACTSFLPQKTDSNDWLINQSVFFDAEIQSAQTVQLRASILADGNYQQLSADSLIDELALSFRPNSYLAFKGGKQNILWGTARAFSSITKLAPPVDPLGSTRYSRSIMGTRFDIIPTWFMSFSGVVLPGQGASSRLKDTTYALRGEFLIGELDFSCGAISQVGLSQNREYTAIADFAYFLSYFGFYGEAQYVLDGEKDTKITAGLQADIPAWSTSSIRFLSEYQWLPENSESKHRVWLNASGIQVVHDLKAAISCLLAADTDLIVYQSSLSWRMSQSFEVACSASYRYKNDTPKRQIWGSNISEIKLSSQAYF